jgi:hypothetical protein
MSALLAPPTLFDQAPARELAAAAPVTTAPPVATTAPPAPIPVAAPVATPEPSTTARAHRQGPTLDDLVAGAWEDLLAGAPGGCPVCARTLQPRHSAGAGVVGGRCGDCGSTLG